MKPTLLVLAVEPQVRIAFRAVCAVAAAAAAVMFFI